MLLSLPSLMLLSLHRSSQGAIQGGGVSSHSYSSTSYSHGQSCDKTGKKRLPKRILIYPVPTGFIFCVPSFPVNTTPRVTNSTLASLTTKPLNFEVSQLWFQKQALFPHFVKTDGHLNNRSICSVRAVRDCRFPIRITVPSFPQGSHECVKIPPTGWSSLIYLLPSKQAGPRHDSTPSTCPVYPPDAEILYKCCS